MNHIKTLAAFAALLLPTWALGQIERGGKPLHWGEPIQETVVWETFGALDLDQLAEEDRVTATMKDAPWRFGVEHEVDFNLTNAGSWSEEDGLRVWRLGVKAEGATSLSFYLEEFQVPKGGELFIYNADRTEFKGAFNHLSVKGWGGLALSLMEGDQVILEYREPVGLSNPGQIAISQVVQGYRSLLQREAELDAAKSAAGPFGNSGACNINVNCPEGADWQVEKKAVALIVNGGFAACTGSLVNNTANDGTPYFLTANHCLGNPNTWTYYFNHESSTCSGSTGPTNNSISGGALLVADGGSDVALIELSSTPPSSWDVEYAGWDASGATPDNATGIHHPSGDVKKICFEEDSPYTSSTGGAAVWWIDAWELGVTEPGSSGSPLFDQNHRIIGQLYGGAAACSGSVNNGAYDYYGRFDVSWGLGVSQYLDPTNSGATVLDGYPTGFNTDEGCTDPTACNYSPLAIIDDGSCAENDACGVCGGDNSSCGGCTNPDACNYDAGAVVDDGSCVLSGVALTFTLLTDNYPAETTWTLTDDAGATVMEGGPYNGQQTTYTAEACVATGCYTLTVNDSFGDGLQYSGVVGNYTMVDGDGNVLAQMIDGGNFGSQAVDNFCVEAGNSVPGCIDSTACNYDAEATADDGSCEYGQTYYLDSDGDGYGSVESGVSCSGVLPGNASFQSGDCNDANSTVYPGAPGTAVGIDNDCSGTLDADEEEVVCPEDVNGDGAISVADILAVLAEFGCTTSCEADVDGDGNVIVSDVLALLAAFGQDC
ncbi:MAG: trypsin-like peptidase domain-containing protein [Flavobacteriales bacterium]